MSDAQFVIEVASQVSGVDATTAELDRLAGMLSGSGVNAAMFDDALAKLAGQMDGAKAATASANAALAVGRANYAQLEASAVSAAKGVEKIEAALSTAQSALASAQSNLDAAVASGAGDAALARYAAAADKAAANLRKASKAAKGLDGAKAAAASAGAAAQAYAAELDQLERAATEAASAQKALETSMANTSKIQRRVNDNLGDSATKFSTFRGALGDIGGPIAEFGERLLFPGQAFVDLNEKFGRGTSIAMVAGFGLARVVTSVVGAFVKLAAGIAVGIAAIASFAFVSSNAARSLALTREAAEILTPALRGLPWREVTDATGIAEARLRDLAKTLIDVKVSTADMPMALRAIATAEAALGQGGADKLVADLKAGKISAAEFADTIVTKFGGVVARQLLGLEAQGARFKRNVGDIFNFDIDPALEGLATLVAMFDKNTSTGRAFRKATKGIMDPIITNAKAAAYVVEAFVLGLSIGAVKIYIAVKPAITKVAELIGIDPSKWKLESVLSAAATAGELVASAVLVSLGVIALFGAAIGVVAGVIGGLMVAASLASVAVIVFGARLLAGGVSAAKALGSVVAGAVGVVTGAVASFVTAGADIVAGIVKGLLAGGPAVIAAITGVVGGAIATAKKLLGIASPSRVFGGIADDTVEGFTSHVDAGTDAAHAAVAELVRPPAPAAGATSSSVSSSVSSTTSNASTVVIESLTLPNITDPDAFLVWLEGVAGKAAA